MLFTLANLFRVDQMIRQWEISVKTGNNARNGGKNSLNRLIRCVCGKKSAQIREILINESAWEEMTCLFFPSFKK
uniref:Uncharacterized protein n=1 Tax=Klebsiella pneumoniae TaxID=573 RepID=A0A8E6L4H4_KLEPN|nr:hypothetical protein [Klebsiella pneumoniae]